MASHATIQGAFRCETGAVRERNEDSCLVFISEGGGHFPLDSVGLFAVADGMGGHSEGHVASNEAIRAFAQSVIPHIGVPENSNAAADEAAVLEALEDGVLAAHERVHRPAPEENGGTTLTAALLLDGRIHIAHVGDSRAYLFKDGKLGLLTNDHSLVRKLQDRGQLTAAEARDYQYRNVLLQALGQDSALDVELSAVEMPPEGRLLLCSDGLSGFVIDDELAAVLAQGFSPQETVDRLYDQAMAAGGHDNITVVVADFTR